MSLTKVRHALEFEQDETEEGETAERPPEEASEAELVASLIDMNYSEELAARAVAECGEEASMDELMDWLEAHKDDEKSEPTTQASSEVEDHATRLLRLLEKHRKQQAESGLTDRLQDIFTDYLTQQKREEA